MYTDRFYRRWARVGGGPTFALCIQESDLLITCDADARDEAGRALLDARRMIEQAIVANPRFRTSLTPVDVADGTPAPVCGMDAAGRRFHVGPMAAVVGAVAEHVGRQLVRTSRHVVVENGGDIYARGDNTGQLSPLLNDPWLRTIGVGTRIFLGGGVGHVWAHGTQHTTAVPRNAAGSPLGGSPTLAVTGDLKRMDARYLRAASIAGYGSP